MEVITRALTMVDGGDKFPARREGILFDTRTV